MNGHGQTRDPDADIRFMALQDLLNEISPRQGTTTAAPAMDDSSEHLALEGVLALLRDAHSEVAHLAARTIAQLVAQTKSETRAQSTLDKLALLCAGKDSASKGASTSSSGAAAGAGTRDVAALALKSAVAAVATRAEVAAALAAASASTSATTSTSSSQAVPGAAIMGSLLRTLSGTAQEQQQSDDARLDALELLAEIASRFERALKPDRPAQLALFKAASANLEHRRPALRKRAVNVIAALAPVADKSVSSNIASLTSSTASTSELAKADQLATKAAIVAALARAAPAKLAPSVDALVPSLISTAREAKTETGGAINADDLRESVFAALEQLVLRCQAPMREHMREVLALALELVKYDPNYAGDDDDDDDNDGDEDEDAEMADVSDDDDDYADAYSDDDDDTAWKVRRGSARVISALLATRAHDALSELVDQVAPVLIRRCAHEREETVKLEVASAYATLLRQTKIWGATTTTTTTTTTTITQQQQKPSLKRKRSDAKMRDADSPVELVRTQAPSLVRALLAQLKTLKTLALRQAFFQLLRLLVDVLGANEALGSQARQLAPRIQGALHAPDAGGAGIGSGGTATTLKLEVLALVRAIFEDEDDSELANDAPLADAVAFSIHDRFSKVAVEAFAASSALVRKNTDAADKLFTATFERVKGLDADEEIKSRGLDALADMLFNAQVAAAPEALAYFADRLTSEVARVAAVDAVARAAASPVIADSPELDHWAKSCMCELASLLRKTNRALKVGAFNALASLARRVGERLDKDTLDAVVVDIKPLLSDSSDVTLVPLALSTVVEVLSQSPEALPSISEEITPVVVQTLAPSPLIQGASLDALLSFCSAAVAAGQDPMQLVQALVATTPATGQPLHTVARCVGAVVRDAPQIAPQVVGDLAKAIEAKPSKKSKHNLALSLLILGEVSQHAKSTLYETVVAHFDQPEDVRHAAAVCAGKMAVTQPDALLAPLLKLIQAGDKKRYLALQSVKEVVSAPNVSSEILASLWAPLFASCEASDEGVRNVAADCVGQLAAREPATYLPQLQQRLHAANASTRATAVAAVRFTLSTQQHLEGEHALLSPVVADVCALVHDANLDVRRVALSSLNSAMRTRPQLVREHLATLVPELYAQTAIDTSLVRIVDLGPFKHRIDDGLESRKTAFECLHTLLDTCLTQLALDDFVQHVLRGVTDDADEIKKLAYLMLARLVELAPAAVSPRLDETVPAFQQTLQAKLKDTAVKQEVERLEDVQKAAVRCLAALSKLASLGSFPSSFHDLPQC